MFVLSLTTSVLNILASYWACRRVNSLDTYSAEDITKIKANLVGNQIAQIRSAVEAWVNFQFDQSQFFKVPKECQQFQIRLSTVGTRLRILRACSLEQRTEIFLEADTSTRIELLDCIPDEFLDQLYLKALGQAE